MLAANRVDGVAGKARATQLVVHATQQAVVVGRQHFGRSRGERMARSYGEHDVECQHCPDRVPEQRVERLAISDHSASFSSVQKSCAPQKVDPALIARISLSFVFLDTTRS